MKHITKGMEPQEFTTWKALANDDWAPTYEDLRGIEKRAVHASLIREQGGLCCYCEQSVNINNSHIEHFRPQNYHLVDPLDYGNMLCSCQRLLREREPRHCGNKKGEWFDEVLLISPMDAGCEGRFAYDASGGIRPMDPDDEATTTTIKKLKLDCDKLRSLRKGVIDGLLQGNLTEQEMGESIRGHLGPDGDGVFGEFYTTVAYLFRDYA
ncbi:MAG: TIGR02646 family protein [Syntrophobacterales bacterium]|jgi:uncharacterized protein (TIGR02646 family)|nr:TIGR02646 family protein [Syntrophobacterales bacterium]